MGIIMHDTIIITMTDPTASIIARAREIGRNLASTDTIITKARELGLNVMSTDTPAVNNYMTVVIAPDGSKEGWDESIDAGDRRKKFKHWLSQLDQVDLDWIEVRFGGDVTAPHIVDYSNKDATL